jgi:nicotinate-nucleotide adenylyltransferase
MNNIAIYGGTFSPVHWGHIKTACCIQEHMQFHDFRFLPCKTPVLDKKSTASVQDRIAMLELALKPLSFAIDLSETQRSTPSFMCETLRDLRKNDQHSSITLIMGMDGFMQLPRWRDWETLLDYAHIMVIERAEIQPCFSVVLHELLKRHHTNDKQALLTSTCGKIYRFDAGHYAISSSHVRDALKKKQDIRQLVPDVVYEYICQHHLFE